MTPVVATLAIVDYGIVALYVGLVIAIGLYYAGRQSTSGDFFLARRSLGRWPLALSLTGTLVTAAVYLGLPSAAYEQGLKCLVVPLAVWIAVPVLVGFVLPIFRGLGVATLHEYLELRFDGRVRLLASMALVAWRLVWLAAMIALPGRALCMAAGWDLAPGWLALALVGVTILYVVAGGMKAAVWTDVVQVAAMFAGGLVVIGAVWSHLDGGPQRVLEVAGGLGRLSPADFTFDAQRAWSLWGALPHWLLVALAFYTADQVTAQRLLSTKSVDAARTTFVAHALAISLLQALLIYLGLCLLAYYHDHPQTMRPEWVANVDNLTGEPMRGPDGRPLIAGGRPWTPATLEELVRQKRLLKPNSKEPFTSAKEVIDPETGELSIEMLAMRRPTPGPLKGEMIVANGAHGEMLPHFMARRLPWGVAGLAIVALLAAAMSSIDSSIHSISTILVIDWHRRFGLARGWLARRAGKQVAELTEQDEMRLARPLTLLVGIAATLLALALGQVGSFVSIVISITGILGAPLLGVFLLGLFTRGCTAIGALAAFVGGALAAAGMTAQIKWPGLRILPAGYLPHEIWVFTAGVAVTVLVGIAASLLAGQRKTNTALRGLVVGCGHPGVLASEEEVTVIGELGAETSAIEGDEDDEELRWK